MIDPATLDRTLAALAAAGHAGAQAALAGIVHGARLDLIVGCTALLVALLAVPAMVAAFRRFVAEANDESPLCILWGVVTVVCAICTGIAFAEATTRLPGAIVTLADPHGALAWRLLQTLAPTP